MQTTRFQFSLTPFLTITYLSCLLLVFPACKKNNTVSGYSPTTDSVQTKTATIVGTVTYKSNGYTLIFKNDDPLFDTTMRTKMTEEFFHVYPQLVDRFNPNATHTVKFTVTTSYHEIAATSNDSTYFNSSYLAANPTDIDVVSHEIMHIVQGYHNVPDGDGWLVEGIADYARYTYGVYNAEAGWTLQPYNSTQHYYDGYGVTGHFLVWLQENGWPTIADILNETLRNEAYSDVTWTKATGKTVDELWLAYSQNPSLKIELPSIGTATDLSKNAKLVVSQENGDGASSSEGSLQLIDNNITTKFFTGGFVSNLYMQQQLASAQAATSYILVSGNDNPNRDPRSWQLMGSNDGSSWTTLDSQVDQEFSSRNLTRTYSFINTTVYSYYRLTVSANNGSTDFQLAEWRMLQ